MAGPYRALLVAVSAGVTQGRRGRHQAIGHRARCYHHFVGKEALFRAVYSQVEAEAQARTAEAVDPAGSEVDQIVTGVNAYLDVALDHKIRRITLVDGPAVLGLEPEGPADPHPAYLAMRAALVVAAAVRAGRDLRHLLPDHGPAGGPATDRAGLPAYWLGLGMRPALLPSTMAAVKVCQSWRHLAGLRSHCQRVMGRVAG